MVWKYRGINGQARSTMALLNLISSFWTSENIALRLKTASKQKSAERAQKNVNVSCAALVCIVTVTERCIAGLFHGLRAFSVAANLLSYNRDE